MSERLASATCRARRRSDAVSSIDSFISRTQLAPTGVTLEQLRAAPGGVRVPLQTRHAKHAEPDANGTPRGFATPSRRVELYSQVFLDHGYAPLPDFVEPPVGPVARPDLAARFPLILTSAKSSVFCESQHRGQPGGWPDQAQRVAHGRNRSVQSDGKREALAKLAATGDRVGGASVAICPCSPSTR